MPTFIIQGRYSREALQGMIAFARGTPDDLRRAVVLLRRSARLDPTDVNTLSRLSEALYATGDKADEAEAEEWKRKVERIREAEAVKIPAGPGMGNRPKR